MDKRLLNLDTEKFWADDEIAHKENCFYKNAPQVALGIRMSDECVFDELKEEGKPWGYTPLETRIALNKRYNDISEKIVGKRLLRENFEPESHNFPKTKQIGEIFGGEYLYDGVTTWLHSDIKTLSALEKRLDIIDAMDFESFVLPDNWNAEKKRIFELCGKKPANFRHIRGPVTLATSIFGVENLIFLILDEPELARRFSNTIQKVVMKYIDLFDRESGYVFNPNNDGFYFADDDCAILNPEMYEFFGFPILKAVFEKVDPNKTGTRYQHSDSAMGHLLPTLAKLDLTGCNFGPTLTISEIRKHLPKVRIDGQLAPFTFMNNDLDAIISEVKRDCEMAKIDNLKGVNISTAGSINNGSLLTSMRAVMYAITKYGQYEN